MALRVFSGFPDGPLSLTPLPDQFFSEILPYLDHLGELKVILYTIWRLNRQEAAIRYLQRADYLADDEFMIGLAVDPDQQAEILDDGLARAVRLGVLLSQAPLMGGEELIFLNSPRGRAACAAIQSGDWQPEVEAAPAALPLSEPGRLASLYEQNIGPLTPMLAEELNDAGRDYPAAWIEEAFRIAVQNNARNWRYIHAILERWQKEGRHERKDRRDTEKARRRFVDGEFADFIEH